MPTKKTLSCAQAVAAALILFELNTRKDEVTSMSLHAGLPQGPDIAQKIYLEWLAFLHAALVYTLMHQAPAAVVAAYLRETTHLLKAHAGVETEKASAFIDSTFTPYMECLVQEKQKDCPVLFLQRITGQENTALKPATLRVVSGVMAMALCSIMDALSQYDMQAD